MQALPRSERFTGREYARVSVAQDKRETPACSHPGASLLKFAPPDFAYDSALLLRLRRRVCRYGLICWPGRNMRNTRRVRDLSPLRIADQDSGMIEQKTG